MNIDLKKDGEKLRTMLGDAVGKYVKLHEAKKTAAKHPAVSRIDFWYWLYDGGPNPPVVVLHLDTRSKSEPDGTWTHENFAELKLPKWRAAIETMVEGESVEFILMNGSKKKVGAEALEKTIGEFFVEALKSARKDGVFKALPKTAKCEMGVEESEGSFGWPVYAKRGKDNLA
jgi:hypothetical protein